VGPRLRVVLRRRRRRAERHDVGRDHGCTAGTITAALAAFYTTGSGLAGMPVLVVSPSGACQWVRAQSNTGTVITLDTTNGRPSRQSPSCDGTWTVIVGGIDWYWYTPRFTGGKPGIEKKGWVYSLQGTTTSTTHRIYVGIRYNRRNALTTIKSFTLDLGGMVWGSGIWGTDTWGAAGTRDARAHRIKHCFFDIQFKFYNYYPNQPVQITWFEATADFMPGRRVRRG
jgi:hypothetical protein